MGALVSVLWTYYVWLFPGNLPQAQQLLPEATVTAPTSSSSSSSSNKTIEGIVAKEDDLKNGEYVLLWPCSSLRPFTSLNTFYRLF